MFSEYDEFVRFFDDEVHVFVANDCSDSGKAGNWLVVMPVDEYNKRVVEKGTDFCDGLIEDYNATDIPTGSELYQIIEKEVTSGLYLPLDDVVF